MVKVATFPHSRSHVKFTQTLQTKPPPHSQGKVSALEAGISALGDSETVALKHLQESLKQAKQETQSPPLEEDGGGRVVEEEERRKVEEKEKLKAVKGEEEDPDGWLQAFDIGGDLYYWHRRTRRAKWSPPPSASSKTDRQKRIKSG